MVFKQKDIDELKSIYKEEVGEDLTNEEAWEMATRVLRLLDVVSSPSLPGDEPRE